jgi:hypothetical protein
VTFPSVQEVSNEIHSYKMVGNGKEKEMKKTCFNID